VEGAIKRQISTLLAIVADWLESDALSTE